MFRNRTVVIAAAFAIGILILGGLVGMSSIGSTTVSAAQAPIHGGATADMLNFALNFKKASGFEQFGANGMRNGAGDSFAANAIDPQAGTDLENAVRAIGQLPCEAVDSSSLGGKTFAPGVYCLASAELAGSMTLDGMGDPNAQFVFRVAGGFTAAADSSIALANGAQSINAFFVSADTASIGVRNNIPASIIADGDININDGTIVRGKALSVKGNVNSSEAQVVAATGYIEVCKALFPGDPIAAGTLFTFNVAGTDYQAPAGGCTSPIQVTSGNITVVEAVRANTAVVGIAVNPANRLVSSNFGTRTAVVTVVDGDVNSQSVVTFTNQTTRTGVIEICKYALDTDVTGFFSFNVQGIPAASNPIVVPVGFCSGPITLTIPQVTPTGFTTNITELAQANFRLEAVDTLPAGQLTGPFTPNAGFDAAGAPLASNTNGGYANVALVNSTNPALMTVVNFYNRSLPGLVKVCKITADTRIPVGTLFTFTVSGLHPTSATQTMPGVAATETMTVAAGPVSQNGFCAFAPGTWIIGTPVVVTETGVGPINPFTFADVRVSRIRGLPGLVSSSLVNKTATITARNTTAEVEFTNFIFLPAILKVCKNGGTGVTGSATFTLSLPNALTSFPLVAANTTVTVPVGSCTFANGPFPANSNFPGIGTFNYNTQLALTEAAMGNTVITSVTSPTGGATSLVGRVGTITLSQQANPGNFNEVTFLNSNPAPQPSAARFDFDGDGKSDMAIYRGGTWWYAASNSNMAQTAIQFGAPGDKLVAADYDGDGKTDAAVYRNGMWYVYGSTQGMITMQFGVATDIPQTGDFDGDGKADFAVFRPSTGTWYMQNSSTGFNAVQFGISSDRPVAADFDGDGKVDPAVFRNGTWYILGSSNGFYGVQFGATGDIPVQADYDGDHKADVAVFRGGTWYILGSTTGFKSANFGVATDTPVPADYDGDGKADIAVYRTSTTVWHILQSSQAASLSGGYVAAQFGSSNDVLMNY
jgi:Ice-binding-like/FG-GAP-like repeat